MSSIIQNADQSFQSNPDLEIRMDKALAIIIRETPLADAGCQSAKQLVVNAHLEQEKVWDELEELEIDFHGENL
mgnify:CR=1 FL=1|jgi:hypothetical protein